MKTEQEGVKLSLIIVEVDRKVRMVTHSLSVSVRRLMSPQLPLLQSLCVSIVTANSRFIPLFSFILYHFIVLCWRCGSDD